MTDTTFIYALRDPRDDTIRWVGKTNDPQRRLRQHVACLGKGPRRLAWLCELRDLGLQPEILILEEVSLDQWPEAECFWIEEHLRVGSPLTNSKAGGAGGGGHAGRMTLETRSKMSEASRSSAAVAESRRRVGLKMRGVAKSAEHRRRIAESNRATKRAKTRVRDLLIVRLRGQGVHPLEIAATAGCSYATVYNILKRGDSDV